VPAPQGFVELRSRRAIAWVRADLAALPVAALWAQPAPLPGAKGRGGVGLLQLRPDLCAVVRPFRRGGALARILGERYRAAVRARQELEVLLALRAEGVPVVTPLAAVGQKHRAFWRLRLLTELEAEAQPLPAFCAARPSLRRWAIEAAAVTIRLAFAAGLRHPDLHLDNVLCRAGEGDKVRAVLVDLDKAVLAKPLPESLRDAMLVRLMRHLHKHQGLLGVAPSRSDGLRFLRGLGLDVAQRRQAWARLGSKLRRALGRHGFFWRRRQRGN